VDCESVCSFCNSLGAGVNECAFDCGVIVAVDIVV
jgi:hypothetical protein